MDLDSKKSTDKAYFDRAWKKFNSEVLRSGVLEEIRLKRRFLKPSALKKLKAQICRNKWKFY
ncbi:ribosomal protein S21/MRP21 [bacterium]|nr:ribosomal protein S21/MRP21 [bacterium]